ncbi:MAG: hypothetical protein Q4E17_07255 [Synergistes sp.]|nr:hypothetical protein [Synergistes sp.]
MTMQQTMIEYQRDAKAEGRVNICLSLVRGNLVLKSIAAKEMGISMAQLERQPETA